MTTIIPDWPVQYSVEGAVYGRGERVQATNCSTNLTTHEY